MAAFSITPKPSISRKAASEVMVETKSPKFLPAKKPSETRFRCSPSRMRSSHIALYPAPDRSRIVK